MKKWLSFMLSLILLLCLLSVGAFTVSAGFEDKVFGAFTYNVVEDQVVIIDVQTDISGDVVVPSSIEGYPVTGIGELAFDGCDLMATLKIPAKVKQVEDTAFESCTALTEIKVAFGNQSYCAWNGVLFNKNRTTLVCYPAGKTDTAYAIPDGVKQIAVSAFAEASKLQSITIADTVGKLGEKAFFGCSGLNKVVFGVGLTAIGPEAFAFLTVSMIWAVPRFRVAVSFPR